MSIVPGVVHSLYGDAKARWTINEYADLECPFCKVCCGGLWTTDTGSPIVIRGKDKLAEHAVWSLKCFPDWEWYNIKVFETDDPNHFWVECDGHGKILFPGYPEGYYENHFLHSFELDDGKIKRNREFMNVFQQLRALSIPVPQIKREGIPT